MARQIAAAWPAGATYLNLERPADRRRLVDADAYLRCKALFALLRGCIDERRAKVERSGQFLLLGALRHASGSLAGCVACLGLTSLTCHEIASTGIDLNVLWLSGSFSDSLLASEDLGSALCRKNFILSFLSRMCRCSPEAVGN